MLGTPVPEEVKAMNPAYKNREFPELKPLPFETNFPATTKKSHALFVNAIEATHRGMIFHQWQDGGAAGVPGVRPAPGLPPHHHQ